MTRARTSAFEQFLLLFENLKSACGDDPSALEGGHKQPKIRDAARALDDWLRRSDFEARVYHGRRRTFRQVPQNFQRAWTEFRSAWQAGLLGAYLGPAFPDDLVLEDLENPEDGEKAYSGGTLYGDRFEPEDQDLDKAFGVAIDLLQDEAGHSDDEERYNSFSLPADALEYLRDTVGLDLKLLQQVRRTSQPIFMPAHVSDRYGETSRNSLYALHEEAQRALAFGCGRAALVLCRAMLERTLADHYAQPADPDGESTRLEELINGVPDRALPWGTTKTMLHKLRKETNTIAHAKTDDPDDTKTRETNLGLKFLHVLKLLIEHVPVPDRRQEHDPY